MVAFELAVQDLAGVDIAARAGADRIELCSALAVGGLTPSLGFIEAACAATTPVHVLVRPRDGDFGYSAEEIALTVRDASLAVAAGAVTDEAHAARLRALVDAATGIRRV